MADEKQKNEQNSDEEEGDDVGTRFPTLLSLPEVPEAPKLNPKLPPHPSRPQPGAPQARNYRKMALASQAVSSLVTPIILLSLLGVYLDKHIHTAPWGAFVGVTLGFVVGLNLLMNVLRKMGS